VTGVQAAGLPGTVWLRLNPIACDGRGLCAEVLPELISLDDWGFPVIRDPRVPASLASQAAEAVRLCPKLALRLERSARQPSL
jgi:ferredoxin